MTMIHYEIVHYYYLISLLLLLLFTDYKCIFCWNQKLTFSKNYLNSYPIKY